MTEMEAARDTVLKHLQTLFPLPENDEFIVSFENETQDEWIFSLDTKIRAETSEMPAIVAPGITAVKKDTGEFYFKVVRYGSL